MATLNETPRGERLHIGFLGKRNSGKSSLVNAFAGHGISIVSDTAGTTTDPVYKSMEIHGLGACVLVDTAGFDDEGELGEIRVEKTRLAADKLDVALLVFSGEDWAMEREWAAYFREKSIPVIGVVSKADILPGEEIAARVKAETGLEAVICSAVTGQGLEELKTCLLRAVPESFGERSITGHLAQDGDVVLLVMPQDIQAPKGRLILPQVQTIRDLLDKKCIVISATTDRLEQALGALKEPPRLIITDSQIFGAVYQKKPEESMLTSFSVLFAAYKGDLPYYWESAGALDKLTANSRVLIAECCTHAPLAEDIGRVKLPRMLRERVGEELTVDIVSGTDFPKDLTGYDLVIQCGACMFNRQYVLSRIGRAREQGVPMSNYGVVIAHLTGILDKVAV